VKNNWTTRGWAHSKVPQDVALRTKEKKKSLGLYPKIGSTYMDRRPKLLLKVDSFIFALLYIFATRAYIYLIDKIDMNVTIHE
jgi:hypothetical protein